jgi:HSP20 family protein
MLDTFSTLLRQMDLAERMYLKNNIDSQYYVPLTDIIEEENQWIIYSEIPGVKKEDISISFEDSHLKIEAKKELKYKNKKHSNEETYQGKYQRKFKLNRDVDSKNIEATYENGVLELKIPKIKEKPKLIEVKIK